ncbi:hypothetical protein [Enterovirga sp. CN4-39]|uniref:hypothetical protein n=1 Tax=Enterovirga sp. CN4-39 TaxID=3400910 RepID=UPI003C122977
MASLKIAAAAAGIAAVTIAASIPAEAGGYYGRGWSPGAAAAVGILGGVAAGAAIASAARPAYGPPPAYYAPPPPVPVYGECYVVHRRVWVPGWGWDVRPREICD